jgi:hypothetical protein
MSKAVIYEKVLAHFNHSPSELGAKLGEEPATVGMWRHRGIPAAYARRIELLCGVSVKVTRPEDWHLYWPDLAKPKRAKAAA